MAAAPQSMLMSRRPLRIGDEPAAIEVLVKEKGSTSRSSAKDQAWQAKNQSELRHYASFGAVRPDADRTDPLIFRACDKRVKVASV